MDIVLKAVLMICNIAITIYGFWNIEPENPVSHMRTAIAYAVLVLPRLPLYFYPYPFSVEWLEIAARLMPSVLYLRVGKRLSWAKCIYFSFIVWFGFTMANILRTPWYNGITSTAFPLTCSSAINSVITTVIIRFMDFLAVLILTRCIPLDKIHTIGPERVSMMAFIILCQLYVSQTLPTITGGARANLTHEFIIYLVLMQAFAASGLVLFERFLASRSQWEQTKMAELDARYRYEALRERQDGESDVRRLHHDMKNHLLALRRMVRTPEKAERYIDQLLESELSALEKLPQTGNELLNGLLGDKTLQAEKEGIHIMVNLDFCSCAYMEGADICAVFGNMLDNAIEATRTVPDVKHRTVLLRSEQAAGNLIIVCANPYIGELKKSGRSLVSSKGETGHGIGLSSVRRSVEKYGGIMTLDTEREGIFRIILMLPAKSGKIAETVSL